MARWACPGELHAVVPRPSRRGVYDVWHMFRVTRRLLSEGTVWNSHLKTAAQSMQSCAPLTPLFVVGTSLLHTCVWSQFVPVTIGFAITKLLQGGGAILGKPLRLVCMNMASGGSSLLMCAAPVLCGRHLCFVDDTFGLKRVECSLAASMECVRHQRSLATESMIYRHRGGGVYAQKRRIRSSRHRTTILNSRSAQLNQSASQVICCAQCLHVRCCT